jgi:hypothetical protein
MGLGERRRIRSVLHEGNCGGLETCDWNRSEVDLNGASFMELSVH